ncbi:hypothetical protein C8R45DRAFT_1036223 [Mycena sanguinolenta]|nr:hypothetical protein C8R45DRAFT_1036223 [Mycena sanguinolenta]
MDLNPALDPRSRSSAARLCSTQLALIARVAHSRAPARLIRRLGHRAVRQHPRRCIQALLPWAPAALPPLPQHTPAALRRARARAARLRRPQRSQALPMPALRAYTPPALLPHTLAPRACTPAAPLALRAPIPVARRRPRRPTRARARPVPTLAAPRVLHRLRTSALRVRTLAPRVHPAARPWRTRALAPSTPAPPRVPPARAPHQPPRRAPYPAADRPHSAVTPSSPPRARTGTVA